MRDFYGTDLDAPDAAGEDVAPAPGKRTLTQRIPRRSSALGPADAASRHADGGGSGARLPAPVQAKMEDAFDFSFAAVRVHEGGEANAMGAVAYAQGTDLHFAPGQYDPGSASGLELIGHELAHVVQQHEGRVTPTRQLKGTDLNDDSSLEREADEWGARAARGEPVGRGGGSGAGGAVAQGKAQGPIQRRGPPAGEVAAAHTFTVPPVVDVAAIVDPVQRNHAINQSYHVIDAAMTGYLGAPLVANWFTFGQHASREAGTQIRNLQNGLELMRELLPALQQLAGGANPIALFQTSLRVMRILQRLNDLAQQEGLFQMAWQLALSRAGVQQSEIDRLIADAPGALATAPLLGVMPPLALLRFLPFMGRLMSVAGRLIAAIPAIIESVERVYRNMVRGNREIYQNVAPAANAFLTAAQAAPDGLPGAVAFGRDASGFLAAAFAEYIDCRRLGDEARAAPGTPESQTKLQQRQQKAARANLLIGFQEQLVILQPIFDTMREELRAMSGTMVLHDPNGAHPLANNWGDFYTRMGIDPAQAPADPRDIRPDRLPPLLPPERRRGTISEYFEQGLTNERVHEAPPPIAPV